ncbi:PAS domain S-box protein [Candidatus Gracilibacteria bacterium]|nr:PAS domain S-box protein [Candidatus Gracilibacteria bacterium]
MDNPNSFLALPKLEVLIDRTPLIVTPDTSIVDAIALMSQTQGSSCVLIVREANLIGIFTERDALKAVASQIDLRMAIAQVMTSSLITQVLEREQTIFTVLSTLQQHKISHLPILNETGNLIGLVTPTRLLQAIAIADVPEATIQECSAELSHLNAQIKQEIKKHRQTESEIADFIENAVVPLHWVAEDSTIIWANQAELDLLGYTKEEYIGQPIAKFHVDSEILSDILQRLATHQPVKGYEARLRCKDGSIRHALIDSNTFWKDGKFIHTRCFTRDISERKQAEESLRESEQKFRAIFDGTFQFIGLLTTEGIVIEANLTALNSIGAKRSEIIGRPFWETPWWTHSPQLQEQLKKGIIRAAAGELVRFEAEHFLVDGTSIFVDFSLKPVFDEAGKVVMLIPEGRDISERQAALRERKQAEIVFKKTLKSLEFQKSALDRAAIVAITDRYGVITYVNEQFCQISQYSKEELLGKTHRIINSGYHPLEFFQNLWTTIASGQVWQGEIKNRAKDGSFYWVATTIVPFLDDRGIPFQYLAIRFDISNLKQAEQKIGEQAALLDVSSDGIMVRDLENRIQFWNKGAEKIYGWRATEAIGKNVTTLLYRETLPEVEEALKTVRDRGEWQGELHKVTKTGKQVIVESRWTLVRDEANNPKAILIVDTDITEKQLLEKQFLRAQRLESLGTLASGIAHDMNNILTPILAITQLLPLKMPHLDDRTQRLLEMLGENAKRGSDLVKQILFFARGADGQRILIQVGHILAEVASVARQTFPKSINLVLNFPTSNLWMVAADATQLHQVLMNLVINARDAMPDGGTLNIAAENVIVDENYAQLHIDARVGAYVVVTISDTGIGISPENLERIFEPFFTTKELGQGTGLGLSTVLGIVKSHQGFINVYSEVNRGTCFKIYLPARESIDRLQSAENLERFTGKGELILVVDDEVSVREITKASLETYNYRAMTASDGAEAIALYEQHQSEIAVVLLDLMMPSLDSATIINVLQKINSQVKIIAMSGLVSNGEVAKASSKGVCEFLAKPFTIQELLQALLRIKSKLD